MAALPILELFTNSSDANIDRDIEPATAQERFFLSEIESIFRKTKGDTSTMSSGTAENVTAFIESLSHFQGKMRFGMLRNTFMVFTMQNGFGLLEAGCVSVKNMANIMAKNVLDVCFGGLVYWLVGYDISFNTPPYLSRSSEDNSTYASNVGSGSYYTQFFFHLSFATTATTIVSGAVAERMRLSSYIVFSALNVLIYSFCVGSAWSPGGFLRELGYYDFAGVGVVHLNGGASALAAVTIIGSRVGRFHHRGDDDTAPPVEYQLSSPVTVLTGTFILWWAWLGFNCGSTYGVSGDMWKVAALVGVNTIQGSIGGGITGVALSLLLHRGECYDISYISVSILSGLVAVTGACSVITPTEAFVCGCAAAALAIMTVVLLERLQLDDPVGAIAVHFSSAIVGVLAVGLFAKEVFNKGALNGRMGLWHGGGAHLLGIQLFSACCMTIWSLLATSLCFVVLKYTIGLRVSLEAEILGADYVEHGIPVHSYDLVKKVELALRAKQRPLSEQQFKKKELQDILNDRHQHNRTDLMQWIRENVVAKQTRRKLLVANKIGVAFNVSGGVQQFNNSLTLRELENADDKLEEDNDHPQFNAPAVPIFHE